MNLKKVFNFTKLVSLSADIDITVKAVDPQFSCNLTTILITLTHTHTHTHTHIYIYIDTLYKLHN